VFLHGRLRLITDNHEGALDNKGKLRRRRARIRACRLLFDLGFELLDVPSEIGVGEGSGR
jgi:hypothetical protein